MGRHCRDRCCHAAGAGPAALSARHRRLRGALTDHDRLWCAAMVSPAALDARSWRSLESGVETLPASRRAVPDSGGAEPVRSRSRPTAHGSLPTLPRLRGDGHGLAHPRCAARAALPQAPARRLRARRPARRPRLAGPRGRGVGGGGRHRGQVGRRRATRRVLRAPRRTGRPHRPRRNDEAAVGCLAPADLAVERGAHTSSRGAAHDADPDGLRRGPVGSEPGRAGRGGGRGGLRVEARGRPDPLDVAAAPRSTRQRRPRGGPPARRPAGGVAHGVADPRRAAPAGLPRPRVQHRVGPHRLDLAYPEALLGVEHDGPHHRAAEQARRDLEREAFLARAGWRVVRFASWTVLHEPDRIAREVGALLAAS